MNDNMIKKLNNEVKNKIKSRDMYKIIFTNEDGKDIEYEILLTFRSKSNNKIYYVMTDNTRNNKLNIIPFYVECDKDIEENTDIEEEFFPVTDEEELEMVFNVFNDVKDKI